MAGMDLNYTTYNHTQVIDLSSANTCNSFLPYPISLYGAASGFIDNDLVICGGANKTNAMDGCYMHDMYSEEGEWTHLYKMTSRRKNHAMATFPNGSLWITGTLIKAHKTIKSN